MTLDKEKRMGAEAVRDEAQGDPRSTLEEQGVVSAVKSGDHRSAVALCARHYGAAIGRLCMALVGSQEEADDLTQETLIDAHAGFGSWRGDSTVRSWLFAIARRKCARHLERTTRRQARLRLVHDSERGNSSEELLALRQTSEKARQALGAIRPSEREALVLRYAGELSFREVGDACGIDEAAARKRVSRALARLRDAVKE
jgi:RNA polymerase sigma-70 factor (ECF subfamily)